MYTTFGISKNKQVIEKMNFIPLAKPNIKEDDIERVVAVLRTGMLVQGESVIKLEKAFSEYHHVINAIVMSNGTATLQLALLCAGIGPGDEVIIPAFSYVATANVVELTGAKPVFVDIDITTYNIDAAGIEEKITPRTKAIIPVHEFGLACDIESVVQIGKHYKLFIIEDAACALGATQHGQAVGTFGDFGSFSLHPRKSITAGEGGILLTNNETFSNKARALRNHGIDPVSSKMEFIEAGFNYRMTDFQAALVLGQFERLGENLRRKNEIADIYLSEITNNAIRLPVIPPGFNHTWQTFHLLLTDGLNRDNTIAKLKELNIGTNYGAQCIPAQTYYAGKYGLNVERDFPNAYKAYLQGLAIPIYERLSNEEVYYISKCINKL